MCWQRSGVWKSGPAREPHDGQPLFGHPNWESVQGPYCLWKGLLGRPGTRMGRDGAVQTSLGALQVSSEEEEWWRLGSSAPRWDLPC